MTRSRSGSSPRTARSTPATSPTRRSRRATTRSSILAAEDYLAGNPAQDPDGPHYLSYYTDALDANGVGTTSTTSTAWATQAPDLLGVLSHYDAVVWYTGDDYLTRRPGQPPGTGTARLAVEEMIAVRAFLNEGGKLLYTGKRAGLQYAEGNEFRNFGFPEPDGAPGRRDRRQRLRPAVLQQERDGQGPDHAARSTRGTSSTRTTRRSPTAASLTTTTSSSTTWGRTST